MTVAHGGLSGQAFLDCSSSSLNGTPILFPSHQDSSIMKHKFSSPLAECYAYDHGRDASSSCHDDDQGPHPPKSDISHNHPHREEDARFPRPFIKSWYEGKSPFKNENGLSFNLNNLHSEQETETRRISANLHKVLFNGSKQEKATSRQKFLGTERERPTNTQTNKKPLLSPITFTSQADMSDTSDSTWESSYSLHSKHDSRLQPPSKVSDGNRCKFPPSEGFDYLNKESMGERQLPYIRPRKKNASRGRSISLGEGLRSELRLGDRLESEAGNKVTNFAFKPGASKGLRRSAGSLSLKKRPWIDQIVEAGSCKPAGITPTQGPGKPRLWIDATRSEEGIEEAHLTTVTQSPTKPKVINISRRDSATTPPKMLSAEPHSQFNSSQKLGTPPDTPHESVGLDIPADRCPIQSSNESSIHDRLQEYPYTPPTSRISTPQARSTVRRAVPVTSTVSRPREARSPDTPYCYESNRVEYVVRELEGALNNYPTARLYLDSPIVNYIRLFSAASVSSPQTLCRTPLASAPHSRYSIFRPLSSHSLTPQSAPSYRGVQCHGNAATLRVSPSLPSASCASPYFPNSKDGSTNSALRIIFPRAPAALLDSLQATYIALNYISSEPSASPSSVSKCSSTPSPISSLRSVSSIPAKALATLGICTSGRPSAASTSWLRSASPDHQAAAMSTNEQRKLKERSEDLRINLRLLIRGLLGEIEGRRLSKKDESLVRAVGEVVRCGEAASTGYE